MALLITDTSIGVSQRNALCQWTRQAPASDCRIRLDIGTTFMQKSPPWHC
jgi:hypothetical protein